MVTAAVGGYQRGNSGKHQVMMSVISQLVATVVNEQVIVKHE